MFTVNIKVNFVKCNSQGDKEICVQITESSFSHVAVQLLPWTFVIAVNSIILRLRRRLMNYKTRRLNVFIILLISLSNSYANEHLHGDN